MLNKERPASLKAMAGRYVGMHFGAHPLNSQNSIPIQARLTGSTVCIAEGLKSDTGSPVLAICRKLVDAGHNPDRALEAFRDSTLCLRVRAIGEAAELRVNPKGTGFVKAARAVPIAPPIAPLARRPL